MEFKETYGGSETVKVRKLVTREKFVVDRRGKMRSELADMIAFWEYNMNRTCFFYGVKKSTDTFRNFNERRLQAEENNVIAMRSGLTLSKLTRQN